MRVRRLKRYGRKRNKIGTQPRQHLTPAAEGDTFVRMAAECVICKAQTQLYNNGVPVCVTCSEGRDSKPKLPTSDQPVLNILRRDLQAAEERASAATAAFNAVIGDVPSGMPHPDGTQRIHNASRERSQARAGLMIAHNRLNDYLARGAVPDDLKQVS
jgi:hypothetical protein